jgi:hypothetical protein
MRRDKIIKICIIHVFCPLIIGGVIYISFRSMSLRFFDYLDTLGIKTAVSFIRNILHPFKNELPTWTYFSLPDGLWVYSFSSALIILWGDQFNFGKYWLIIPLLFGAFIELAQKIKIFPGTFDIIDFTFSIVALVLSIIILKPKIQKNEKHYV